MRILVTGAAGFIGQAVASELARRSEPSVVRLHDRVPADAPADRRFEVVTGELAETGVIPALIDGIDVVVHLASVPGGTSEADPVLSRAVNLDASLALLEAMDARPRAGRFVYASSIAVLGVPGGPVDDATPAAPVLTYGAHKRMVEIALADFQRRGRLSGTALRLPGVVARPRVANGLGSAFMSDLIHAGAADEPIEIPVSPAATLWLSSARRTARNLVHAVSLDRADGRALTLPALRTTAAALAEACYAGPHRATFAPDAAIQRAFGSMPELRAAAAEELGFRTDASVAELVASVQTSA